MPASKSSGIFPMPLVAAFGRLRRSGRAVTGILGREPLPPLLAVEGNPDPSLMRVIEAAASQLGVVIARVDAVDELASDPDLASVRAVILTRPRGLRQLPPAVAHARALLGERPVVAFAPQPLTASQASAMPLDPAFLQPPITLERLLAALDGKHPDRA